MKIEIELPDELYKALKIDFASQVIAEKFLGQELSASTKVVDLVLKAAQQMRAADEPTRCPACDELTVYGGECHSALCPSAHR